MYLERKIIYLSTACVKIILLAYKKKIRSRTNPFRNCSSSFSVGLPRSACAHYAQPIESIISIFTIRQLSATSLIKSVTSKLSTNRHSQRTTRPKPKGKAVEKKEPLGSQSLTANIIAQFCKFVESP